MPKDQANFRQLLHSNFPIIIVETHDEQRVVDAPPVESVIADRMRDEVVVGQHQVKQVIEAFMVDDIDVANTFAAPGGFRKHSRSLHRETGAQGSLRWD